MKDERKPAPFTVTRAGIVGTLGVLVVAMVCVRLGFWQLDRLDQKRTLNQAIAERSNLPALTLAAPVADTTGLLLRQVILEGEFDNEHTIVLAGYSHRGVPGAHLITPLRLAGGWGTILVNRGWVPSPDASTVDLPAYRHDGAVTLRGLARGFPEVVDRAARRAAARSAADNPGAVADRGTRRIVWYQLDPSALRAQYPYPILDYYVQRLADQGAAEQLPLALPIPELDEGSHFSYAVQWFSFAAIFIVGWIALLARQGSSEASRRAPPLPVAPHLPRRSARGPADQTSGKSGTSGLPGGSGVMRRSRPRSRE